MTAFDLVIRNGHVATSEDEFDTDIGVTDGRIAALGAGLEEGTEEIDAAGKLITPGGVDSHCHVEQISANGVWTADDWFTATRSAACGGTTTIIPFACQHRGNSLRDVVQAYHEMAGPKAVIDYAFHLIVSDPTAQVLGQELPALIKDGYTSFKIYLTYDALMLTDRQFLDVLAVARRDGAMVMVHAENNDMIAWMAERLLQAGLRAPKFHAVARPMLVEREATHRSIALAELVDVPVLIVHVSGAEAIEQIRWARDRGLKVYAETCPQYLFLTADDMDKPGLEGAKHMCSPPPRDKANQEIVWQALKDGVFEVVSSDHAPYRFDHPEGKLKAGPDPHFKQIANGVPGLEVRMPLLYSEGVGKGRLSLQEFVALTATNAAKLYGLHPRKGDIAVGADADLVIWDTERNVIISQSLMHDNMDYTPYEGIEVTGWPETTLSRGRVVWNDGEFSAEPGSGVFYKCDEPPALSAPARPVTPFDPIEGRLR
ncbi:MAG: dihydropyrimidinase [Rhodospirillaceae bacterium]|jgi:dihydropyrimidinase|nr:dihydropyrimidinase [Rhodospirillaceae bacterium]